MDRLHTCYAPVRRSPPYPYCYFNALPLDLHVLGLSLAFILSQDQTLRCKKNYNLAQNNLSTCTSTNNSWSTIDLLDIVLDGGQIYPNFLYRRKFSVKPRSMPPYIFHLYYIIVESISQRSLFCFVPSFRAKATAKVLLFFELPKFFCIFFDFFAFFW